MLLIDFSHYESVYLLFYTTQGHLCREWYPSHSGLDPLTSVIIQENNPQSCLQTNLTEAFSN